MWGCNEKVSGGAGMTNAISVKDRLKKQAIEDFTSISFSQKFLASFKSVSIINILLIF